MKRHESDAFGHWLDATLTDRGIKGHDLAVAVGVDDSAVSRWRSGTGRPTMKTLMLVAKELDVDPLRLAATANLLDSEIAGLTPLPTPPRRLRREIVREQIQKIRGLTEFSRQKLLETYDEIENEAD